MRIFLIFAFCYLLFVVSPIRASNSDFYTQTKLTSHFTESGESHSKLQLTLRNLTSQNYPQSLKISIHGPKISLITAKDDYGDLNYTYIYEPSGINTFEFKLNRRLVGKNVITHLNLSYNNPEALRSENTWIIFFPKITTSTVSDFQYSLTVPNSFGRLIASEVTPQIINQTDAETTYTLSGKDLLSSPRLIFGDSYPYAFKLTYQPTSKLVLPKDTTSQKIYLTQISPDAQNLSLIDNTWVAEFPAISKDIVVNGYVVFFNENSKLEINQVANYSQPKEIELNPHPYQYLPPKSASLSVQPPNFFIPLFKNRIDLEIKNPNSQALYNLIFSVTSNSFKLLSPTNPHITVIPPTGNLKFPIYINTDFSTLFNYPEFQITLGSTRFSYNLKTSSLIFVYLFYYVFFAFTFTFIIYLIYLTRRLLLQRQKPPNHIHRQG